MISTDVDTLLPIEILTFAVPEQILSMNPFVILQHGFSGLLNSVNSYVIFVSLQLVGY